MSRWASRIAVGLLILTLVSSGVAMGFTRGEEFIGSVVFSLWLAVLASVGAVLGARRPENPIGWLMLGAAACLSVGTFADAYASYSLEFSAAPLPLDVFLAWIAAWITVPGFGLLLFVLLLFPTGTFTSATWRWGGRFIALALIIQSVSIAVRPGPIDVVPGVTNPLGIAEWQGSIRFLTEGAGGSALTGVSLIIVVARITDLLITRRKASGIERQQTKWFVYSVVACVGIIGAAQLMFVFEGDGDGESVLNFFGFLAIMAGLMLVPVAMGVSILHYRLYDIDRIISRTIVYVLVTGSLITVYAGTVFIVGTVAVGSSDNLTVAIATLAAAAAFRPLLARVRDLVDRRFYRHKYDAQKTVDAFGSRLREETDLDELTGDLVGVVRTTMQPEHVSLWLKHAQAEP